MLAARFPSESARPLNVVVDVVVDVVVLTSQTLLLRFQVKTSMAFVMKIANSISFFYENP